MLNPGLIGVPRVFQIPTNKKTKRTASFFYSSIGSLRFLIVTLRPNIIMHLSHGLLVTGRAVISISVGRNPVMVICQIFAANHAADFFRLFV